jgi:hypothetical protein
MKNLKIEHKGFSQVSKYLILEHSANFATIIDALVYITQNIVKLVTISNRRQ